jgi:hypothetical protein
MPVKDPSEGCRGIKEAAILAALQRIRLCEAAAEVLDKLAQRLQTRWTACSRSLRPWGGLRALLPVHRQRWQSCLSTPGGLKAEAGW